MNTIASLRHEIDEVHKELHALLLRRRDLTMAIWKIKKAEGLPFLSPEREAQILKDFARDGGDPQMDELLTGIMRSVLREYEKYLRANFP